MSEALQRAVREGRQREWSALLVVNGEGRVLATDGDVPAEAVADTEAAMLADCFAIGRDESIGRGLALAGQHYDLFRFHPPVLFGRRGDPTKFTGEGIAVYRVPIGDAAAASGEGEEAKGEATDGAAGAAGEGGEAGESGATGPALFVVILYPFPANAAKCVGQLQEFAETLKSVEL